MKDFIMPVVKYRSKQDEKQLIMSSDLVAHLGMGEEQNIKLQVGQTHMNMDLKVNAAEKSRNTIIINANLARKLHIYPNRKYAVSGRGTIIQIGPVVGIMAETSRISKKPFGGQSFFIKQLLQSGQALGQICFAFSPFSIDWKSKSIHGYSWGENGWIQGHFPLPDVIYPREKAYSPVKLNIRKKLENMGVRFLNPALVGKWQTYRVITQNPSLVPYIPDTRLVNSFSQVDRMIKKYNAVYLKPIAGSQGRNIVRVVKKKNDTSYQYQYQLNGRLIKGSASSLAQLRSCLKPVMGNRTYIAQKQINLLQSAGNIIDVRILVQKDHSGNWDVTGMACRVGRPGSITSNISAGGSGRKLETTLKEKFPDKEKQQEIIERLRFVAVEACRTLEGTIGPCGEMGVDIGIDKGGKVWFIEANLRPARQVFTLIGEKNTRLLSVKRPMLYCRYLAGF
ncbi:MAG: YheC/YheD family protein [Syntrophomonas sp.]|uniref:YheC/YheD family endospore coat-associated protein n=1 Tax=Syntrophomonas sp. TaxID=2053627 RepID=UPI00260E92F1|nr:YheC/YheD family protein [Syntrophomonas sp.]MDD2509783.1 YheC/YheD family protein [Syntrophomonas sp.]MDD3878891.1 YheC/YheD family protein [Syntrophomonas sp.]MDD4625724.1 YheC/YheD family protein [Syntrophomonas sp.]